MVVSVAEDLDRSCTPVASVVPCSMNKHLCELSAHKHTPLVLSQHVLIPLLLLPPSRSPSLLPTLAQSSSQDLTRTAGPNTSLMDSNTIPAT